MAGKRLRRAALLICSTAIISGCVKDGEFNLFEPSAGGAEVSSNAGATGTSGGSVKLIERDVEAPEVFQAEGQGLWDGRPSLGGVWVAHSDAVDPERVIIRNEENGKFVIGALFKRERENPGPPIQVSSDAATALGMLAGAPDTLSVIALIRQEVPIVEETAAPAGAEGLPAAEEIATASLDDPIDAAGAALSNVKPVSAPASAADLETAAGAALARSAPQASSGSGSKLDKPFVQIGLFSVEQNAKNAGVSLRNAGILPSIVEESSKGKKYYRVTVGPAPSTADRAAMLKKVKGLGYNDAYFVRK